VKAAGTDNELNLNVIRPGGVVGELSFLDGATRYASLIALSDTRVLGLARADLEGLLETRPKVVYHVMRAIVRVVHDIQRRLSMQTAELTNYLYKTHGRY
jgi:CRP-like cAMP-binding protein